jgi:beta-barrel assembly-enhancing protease
MRCIPLTPLLARLLLALLLMLPGLPTWALDTDLPDLGNTAGALMTPKREQELGRAFMRSVRKSQKVIDDPLLTEYIRDLGRRLVERSEHRGTALEFFVIDDPQINAFAGPGGHIGVYTGLILTTETESELAAVLAHEIAHVTQQHLLRTWESTSRMSIPSAALLIAAIALGAAVGGDAAAAAAIGGQAAMVQQRINFTRANEKEADRVGIELLADAGFEPRAMPSFFSRMGRANRVYEGSLPEYLLTHPVTTSRTADALGRAESFPYRQAHEDLGFQLARMHLLQRQIESPQQATREFGQMLEDGRFRNESAVRYAIALAMIRNRDFDGAAGYLDDLLEQHPDRVEFIVNRARAASLQGDHAAALDRLDAALDADPGSLALNLTFAETALEAGQPGRAAERLERFLDYEADEPRVYRLLAQAAGAVGRRAEGHEYLAEYHYRDGDLDEAVMQLEIALDQPGLNFFDSSRLESRLAAVKAERDDRENAR